jgi:phytoene desaturase
MKRKVERLALSGPCTGVAYTLVADPGRDAESGRTAVTKAMPAGACPSFDRRGAADSSRGLGEEAGTVASTRRSIAVVGAGPGGLAAAVVLAASGLEVTVYEAASVVGGRTSRVTLGAGSESGRAYHVDRGPTFFLMPYVLEEIVRSAGRRLSDVVDLRRLDPMYRLIVGGGPDASSGVARTTVIEATQDIESMAARLGALDAADGPAFERMIAENRAKLELMTPILRSRITSPLDLVNMGSVKVAPYLNPHLSVNGYLSSRFRHPATRLALSFQSKYLGMSPYDCPSLFSILPLIEYEYGVWHPIGGCSAVMAALARIVEELGGRIETGARVTRAEFDEKRRLRGLRISGPDGVERTVEHEHVVINADATWALKNLIAPELRHGRGALGSLLGSSGGADSDEAIDAKRYSCSTFMLYLGVKGGVDLPHHTIYVSSKYRENLEDISRTGRLSEDPSLYVCNPSVTDSTLAPAGDSSLYVLLPCPNTKVGAPPLDWSRAAGEARRLCLEQIAERFGVRDLERRIVAEQVVTPADWRAANINHGATFNLAHNLGQMLHKRVHNKLPGFEGVWFVGGGTHPGSGLPVIWLSSQTTARAVCEEVGVGCALDGPARVEVGV